MPSKRGKKKGVKLSESPEPFSSLSAAEAVSFTLQSADVSFSSPLDIEISTSFLPYAFTAV